MHWLSRRSRCVIARIYRCRNCPRAETSRPSSVSARSSRYESSIGKRGGAPPGLGIRDRHLNCLPPRVGEGKRLLVQREQVGVHPYFGLEEGVRSEGKLASTLSN